MAFGQETVADLDLMVPDSQSTISGAAGLSGQVLCLAFPTSKFKSPLPTRTVKAAGIAVPGEGVWKGPGTAACWLQAYRLPFSYRWKVSVEGPSEQRQQRKHLGSV